jgi:hypothetical protein
MTYFNYIDDDDPAALLGEVVRERNNLFTDLASGRYREALETGQALLSRIDEHAARHVEEWSTRGWGSPDDVASLPLLTQRLGLISDCVLAAIGARDMQSAADLLAELEASAQLMEGSRGWGRAAEVLMNVGTSVCVHGNSTLDPGGNCMRKPPCPQ